MSDHQPLLRTLNQAFIKLSKDIHLVFMWFHFLSICPLIYMEKFYHQASMFAISFFFFLWSVHIAFFPPRQLEDTVKVDTAHVFSQGAHGSNRLVLPHWGCLPQSCGNLTLQCFHNIVIWVELHGCIKLSMDNLHTRKLHLQRNVRGHLSRNFQVAWADGANGTDRRRGAASTGTVSPGRRAAATVLRTPWHRDDTRDRENTENKYREVRRNWDRRGDRISLIPG